MKARLEDGRFEKILRGLSRGRVTVLGDAMLDVFVFGEVTRISPEAPVPVVRVTDEVERLGGAANVALNVKALGGRPVLVGVAGRDGAGDRLAKAARKVGVDARFVRLGDRPTTVKTRVMAHQHQMVRTDREAVEVIPTPVEAALAARVKRAITRGGALIVSDYQKGVVTRGLMREVIAAARARGARVLVDPKVKNIGLFRGAYLVTPNQREAEQISGVTIRRDGDAETAIRLIARDAGTEGALVTRGEEGMSLGLRAGRGRFEFWHVRATAREVFDVTGAGDTAIATLALALVAGAAPHEAMVISNLAAGAAVGKLGTSSVSVDEIRAAAAHS
jgi:rfaE bifunctional protein kinase chain/domain